MQVLVLQNEQPETKTENQKIANIQYLLPNAKLVNYETMFGARELMDYTKKAI